MVLVLHTVITPNTEFLETLNILQAELQKTVNQKILFIIVFTSVFAPFKTDYKLGVCYEESTLIEMTFITRLNGVLDLN
ncbi:hypothetical protein VNO80_11085 [Phaseolus coccineus]|uniref:Uncharacterized protein n=1 Tax=Phaseolus coccineus TaxID=3886 RepID=A0AAN9RE13_PHACN